jgi:hypothetical protein
MPLARYFFFVGGILLALLFFSDAYLPKPAPSEAVADGFRPVVRIHSAQKLPERIVIDTSIPTIVPPPTVVADVPAKIPALDALAQITPSDLKTADLKKPEPKASAKRRVVKRQLRQPLVTYAQARRVDFDFFPHN